MKLTNQYTVLNSDRATKSQQIDLYDFATLKKINTLIDTKSQTLLSEGIDSYTFNQDGKMILIANNTNQIFRHSFTADFYLYTIATKELTKLFDQVQEPTFSPDGKKIAFGKENNLYVYDLASQKTSQITRKYALVSSKKSNTLWFSLFGQLFIAKIVKLLVKYNETE